MRLGWERHGGVLRTLAMSLCPEGIQSVEANDALVRAPTLAGHALCGAGECARAGYLGAV